MAISHGSMYSPIWHRVEGLRPRLQPHTTIERQVIRGDIWYVAKDRVSNRAHRFSPGVYAVLMRMDGRNTLEFIWMQVVDLFGEDAPSQDQVIHLLSQLYSLDLIQVDHVVDLDELADRSGRWRRRQAMQRFQNPLFFRIPLFDPEYFLAATLHLVRPLFSPIGALAWVALVGWFCVQAVVNWEALTGGLADRVLATDNLVLLFVIFPLLKIVHELGHAYATKISGGEVHEIGIMFLVFMPAPYVDASDSGAFPRSRDRILVASAGMLVELMIAAGAMVIWLAVEPGLVRSLAFNTMLIASVSTLIFNGNPLLRFDGYYILCDLIEIPNLATRAPQFYAYLVQRYLFGSQSVSNPASARGEAAWFLLFAPASLAYRLVVLFGIAAFVGTQFFIVGVALALWTAFLAVIWPLIKMAKFVLMSPSLSGHRKTALAMSGLIATGVILLVCALPVPHGTVVRGLVWIPDDARVYAETNGLVVAILKESGSTVEKGDALIALDDPFIQSQRRLLQARLAELEFRLTAAEAATPYDVQVLQRQIEYLRGELSESDRKISALTVRAMSAGRLTIPRPQDLIATYTKKGQVLGYVFSEGPTGVHAFVPEADIDTVMTALNGISVRLDGTIDRTVDAQLVRDIPNVGRKLPSPALAQANNGPFPTDPSAKDGDISLLPFVEIDLHLAQTDGDPRWGERAWIRFDHGTPPIAERVYRSLRQLLLKRFNV
jgi:putative peptide zinc metalloprotease protein